MKVFINISIVLLILCSQVYSRLKDSSSVIKGDTIDAGNDSEIENLITGFMSFV